VILTTMVGRIDLMRETVEIRILPGRLPALLTGENNKRDGNPLEQDNEPVITLTVPARLKRTGMETRLLIEGAGGGARRRPDHSLCRILVQAHRYNAMVMRNDGKTMERLAAEAGVGGSYFSRILRLSFLAPEIVKAILRDRHPIELTAKRLANDVRLSITWDTQRALLATG
jgi:site-specific DNA recombinase